MNMDMRDDLRQKKNEAAIDRTLAALGRVIPPEGMEARINQRLRYASALGGTRTPVRTSLRTWWFGALTGAVLASLVFSIAVLAVRGAGSHAVANNRPAKPQGAHAVAVSRATPAEPHMPCAAPAVDRNPATPKRQRLLPAIATQDNLVGGADDGLTAQERELVRLTKVANPKDLSAMSTEARAALDAQQAAAFQKFFTPPPPPPHDEGVNE